MKDYEQLKMMEYPKDRIDLVIDTDAATEIDDQFAIAYALLSRERFHIRGIYAAPFAMNEKTKDPNVGMQMSYDEIVNIMHLCGENPDGLVFHGAGAYGAPQPSDASMHLVQLAKNYSPEKPLYVAAIGAITNIANITWSRDYRRHLIKNVKHLDRDAIFRDMYKKLGNLET